MATTGVIIRRGFVQPSRSVVCFGRVVVMNNRDRKQQGIQHCDGGEDAGESRREGELTRPITFDSTLYDYCVEVVVVRRW